jgi:antitoxin (DNA-binding transcriptional repressor) of toxin-antitoxin stability system
MKMGVREFRERISDVLDGAEPVLITRNGRIVGRYVPHDMGRDAPDPDDWLAVRRAFRRDWVATTPDWRERLVAAGLDGEDLAPE